MPSILPTSFVKIRHNGLLANAEREVRLALCRCLLLVSSVASVAPSADTASIEPTQPRCCPQCGGIRLIYRELDPAAPTSSPTAPAQDSS